LRILITAQYFYPDDFRINDIACALANRGHQVTVLTGLSDYTTGTVPKRYTWFKNWDEWYHGVQIIRTPVIARRTGAFFRMLNYISFLVCSTLRVSSLRNTCDVLFAYQSSPISMAHAAVHLHKKTGKKIFLYCLDLWPESLKAWNIKESSLLYRLIGKYSGWLYRQCDVIGISSRPFAEYLTQVNHVEKDRIVYLPQHANTAIGESSVYPKKKTDHTFVHFVFAGNIGLVQDVECIIRAVSHLLDKENFSVEIYGNGIAQASCENLATDLQVQDRVHFHGRIPREDLIEVYRQADAFLLTLKSIGYMGMTIPAKLQEYMAVGRPIIAAISGAAEQVIYEAECGLVAPPSDDVALAAHMRAFIDHPETYQIMGNKAYEYYLRNFTLPVYLDKLEVILENIQ